MDFKEGVIVGDGIGDTGVQYEFLKRNFDLKYINKSDYITNWDNNYERTINYDDARSGLNLYFCHYYSFSKDDISNVKNDDIENLQFNDFDLNLSDSNDAIKLMGDYYPSSKKNDYYIEKNGSDFILFKYKIISIQLKNEITDEININAILTLGNSNGKKCYYKIVINPKRVTPVGGGGGGTTDNPSGSTNKVEEKNIFYPYEVGQCLYYFDGEKIKKIVLHEFQTEVTSDEDDITKPQYNILYLKDTHCRVYTELPESGFFTSLRDLYRYIEYMLDIDSSDSDSDVGYVDPDLRDGDILNILNKEVRTKYYYDETTVKHSINTEVYTLIDSKPTNITIKSILYTKRKSLVTFEVEGPIIQYKLQKYNNSNNRWEGPVYIVDEIEIYSDKNNLLNDIKQFEGQLYLGCDICEV